jgi:hypothetical protein
MLEIEYVLVILHQLYENLELRKVINDIGERNISAH